MLTDTPTGIVRAVDSVYCRKFPSSALLYGWLLSIGLCGVAIELEPPEWR